MLDEARFAALLAKATAQDAGTLPAAAALECATINGARALGLEQRIGSIEPGKEADLIAVGHVGAGTCPDVRPHITSAVRKRTRTRY
jgi:5-methylthioadenosine/S-adenosylhomocysteine deaminase